MTLHGPFRLKWFTVAGSAYILSRGSPRGRSAAHIVTVPLLIYLYPPSAGENEIPDLGSFSARLYSLSSMGNWVCNPDGIAALTAPRNSTGNRWVLKDGSHWQVLLSVFQDGIIKTFWFFFFFFMVIILPSRNQLTPPVLLVSFVKCLFWLVC